MKKYLSSSVLLLVILVSFGCARNKGADSGSGTNQEQVSGGGRQAPEKVVDQAQVSCPSSDCPASTGMILSVKNSGLEICTGFLVSPDTVATNSTCIPDELKEGSNDCSSKLRILFPKIPKFEAETIECAQIVSVAEELESNDQLTAPEYAFFKLKKKSTRTPAPVARTGIASDTDVIVTHLSVLSPGTARAELEPIHCRTIGDTLALVPSNGPNTPMIALGECTLNGLSRGAPVIEPRSGNALAIYQSVATPEALDQVKSAISLNPTTFSYAANMACIPSSTGIFSEDLNASIDLPTSCKVHSILLPTRAGLGKPVSLQPNPLNGLGRVSAQAEKWKAAGTNSRYFKWRVVPMAPATPGGETSRFTVEPECFQKPEKWAKDFKSNWPFQDYKQNASFDADLPVWDVSVSLNKYLQSNYEVTFVQTDKVRVSIEPENIVKHRAGLAKVITPARNGEKENLRFQQNSLKVCE